MGGVVMSVKQQILNELETRIRRLEEHRNDHIHVAENQYEELNQALSHVIGVPLLRELTDLHDFVQNLS